MPSRSNCGPFLACATTMAIAMTSPGPAAAQGIDFVRENYLKYEYRIPMRDGIRLFTAVYVPKGAGEGPRQEQLDTGKEKISILSTTAKSPILLMRTPYSIAPYGAESYRSDLGPSPVFGRAGYIVAYQDVRGQWMSEGQFENMRPHRDRKEKPVDIDESTDTYDTIDWLIKNIPGHNGRVGMWGISYPGFYVAAGMIDAHPALKAVSPQAPVTDWFAGDDWHHNGAFFLPHAFGFLASFGRPRPQPTRQSTGRIRYGTSDGYSFYLNMGPLANADRLYLKGDVAFWNEIMRHGTYDEFWQARDIRRHLRGIKPAVMTVGGWYDAENLFGALETYKRVEATSPGATNVLVMGPWRHGGWARGDGASLGPISFHSKTSEFFREHIEFPFFQRYLKDEEAYKFPEAWVFETGTNQWREFDSWPPRKARPRSLYLHPGGRLGFDPPSPATGDGSASFDEYVSDPAHPVEYTEQIEEGMAGDYMIRDQRFASRRPDVATYVGDELKEDVTIVGPIAARMFVSTSGTDSDWVVKLIDVYPDDYPAGRSGGSAKLGGYQQLVRGDVLRGKFRESLSRPEPLTPDRPTLVNLRLQDVAHTFRVSHRIMVQIQSSWFPLVDRNPHTFVDIYQARDSDFRKATQRVYHTVEMPTRLECLQLPR